MRKEGYPVLKHLLLQHRYFCMKNNHLNKIITSKKKTGRLEHLTCEMHVYRSKGSVMVKYLAFVKKGGGVVDISD